MSPVVRVSYDRLLFIPRGKKGVDIVPVDVVDRDEAFPIGAENGAECVIIARRHRTDERVGRGLRAVKRLLRERI